MLVAVCLLCIIYFCYYYLQFGDHAANWTPPVIVAADDISKSDYSTPNNVTKLNFDCCLLLFDKTFLPLSIFFFLVENQWYLDALGIHFNTSSERDKEGQDLLNLRSRKNWSKTPDISWSAEVDWPLGHTLACVCDAPNTQHIIEEGCCWCSTHQKMNEHGVQAPYFRWWMSPRLRKEGKMHITENPKVMAYKKECWTRFSVTHTQRILLFWNSITLT